MSRIDYGSIGRLVLAWNSLEFELRQLITVVAPQAATAALLSADMNAATMSNVLRMLAYEHDDSAKRVNDALLAEMANREKREGVRYAFKQTEMLVPHINHLTRCVDLLRAYRNTYVHGILGAHQGKFFIGTFAAKPRFAFHQHLLPTKEIRIATAQIRRLASYATKLHKAILKNKDPKPSVRPTWPEEPPQPVQLVKHLTYLKDILPPLIASDQ